MKHKIKQNNVDIAGLRPEMVIAWTIACFVFESFSVACRLTCGTDSVHGNGSKHYIGLAIDIGIKDEAGVIFPAELCNNLWKQIKENLGSQFDVILESDHIHIEFDPKIHVS